MEIDAEFFVALGFVIFVLGLGYLGVHNKLAARRSTGASPRSKTNWPKPRACAPKPRP